MPPLLLSKRQAARLLGISRGRTLDELLKAGHLRPVLVLGRLKLPREEVERLAREGTEPAPLPRNSSSMRTNRARRTQDASAAIRALKLD
ncbi:helix-turn-helix domain-containing protein [Myxococcus sp. SDU36]|uniref:helix-turn-helix domain-containing protein n=1 Tax=Myxococcus sp. SDU36 TaxID=2831967 RepID=UPI0032EF9543